MSQMYIHKCIYTYFLCIYVVKRNDVKVNGQISENERNYSLYNIISWVMMHIYNLNTYKFGDEFKMSLDFIGETGHPRLHS